MPGLLEIRTRALFEPWDGSARAVALLEALDSARRIEVDAASPWKGVYGPDLVDVALDLLLDGVSGPVSVLPGERLSEAEFAKALAVVADRDPDLVVATGSPPATPLFAWSDRTSYLPPWETTLERLVREARAARRLGVQGVDRRMDEVREEEPAPPPGAISRPKSRVLGA